MSKKIPFKEQILFATSKKLVTFFLGNNYSGKDSAVANLLKTTKKSSGLLVFPFLMDKYIFAEDELKESLYKDTKIILNNTSIDIRSMKSKEFLYHKHGSYSYIVLHRAHNIKRRFLTQL